MIHTFQSMNNKLENYNELKKLILQLEFELKNYRHLVLKEDVIDSMAFGGSLSEHVITGRTSDKTAEIALNCEEKTERMRLRLRNELENELLDAKLELERMTFYISLLDKKAASILTALYIDEQTYSEICETLQMQLTTVQRIRRKGIDKLVEMYNRVAI